MNTKIFFSFSSVALFTLLSSNVMAFDFPSTSLPGTGGTSTENTPAEVVIFTCINANTGTNTSTNSSCSSSGSSSCSSTPTTSQSSIKAWEMTGDHPALKTVLNGASTTCSEAVEAAGVTNCNTSGGDTLTIYTCKL